MQSRIVHKLRKHQSDLLGPLQPGVQHRARSRMSREVAAEQGSRELWGRRSREPLRRDVDNMGQAFQSVPFWRLTASTPFAPCGRRYPNPRRALHLTQPPNRQNLTQTFTPETLDAAATHDLIRSRYSA